MYRHFDYATTCKSISIRRGEDTILRLPSETPWRHRGDYHRPTLQVCDGHSHRQRRQRMRRHTNELCVSNGDASELQVKGPANPRIPLQPIRRARTRNRERNIIVVQGRIQCRLRDAGKSGCSRSKRSSTLRVAPATSWS